MLNSILLRYTASDMSVKTLLGLTSNEFQEELLSSNVDCAHTCGFA